MSRLPRFIKETIHVHDGVNAYYLYGTNALTGEEEMIATVGTDPEDVEGVDFTSWDHQEGYHFRLVDQKAYDRVQAYKEEYGEAWGAYELEEHFNVSQATFSYGVIANIVRNDTRTFGRLHFDNGLDGREPRVYFGWREDSTTRRSIINPRG